MQQFRPWRANLLMLAAFLAAGCAGQPTAAPATPTNLSPTIGATVAPTATIRPAATSRPTATPTPIPANLGETVEAGSFDVAVLDVFLHDRVYTGDNYYHYANPGYQIVDLFVRLRNLGTRPISINWDVVYITDEQGDSQAPTFAGLRLAGTGEEVAPFDIPTDIRVDEHRAFEFKNSAFLRLYYVLPDKAEQRILFGIAESPVFELTVKK